MTTTTISGAYPGGYYLQPSHQTLDIGVAAYVGGTGVTTAASAPSTINNLGKVLGADQGITLADGGRVVNGGTANVAAWIGGLAPIVVSAGAGTVINRGLIVSTGITTAGTVTTALSVELTAGGAVTNAAGGTISSGIAIAGSAGRVVNDGTVGGFGSSFYYNEQFAGSTVLVSSAYTFSASVSMTHGGSVANGSATQTAAVLSNGVSISGGAGTVVNLGRIGAFGYSNSYSNYWSESYHDSFASAAGVTMTDGGRLTNGSLTDPAAYILGVAISGGAGVVINNGTIVGGRSGSSSAYYEGPNEPWISSFSELFAEAVSLAAGGRVVNGSAANHAASLYGVAISGGAGTVINDGSIGAGYLQSFSYGPLPSVLMTAGGTLTNGSAGDTAAVLGSDVEISGGAGVVVNAGTIRFPQNGSRSAPSPLGPSVTLATGRLTNGSATNASARIENGVVLTGAGSVTNFGTIAAYSGWTAIAFGSVADRLIEEGSGVLTGTVIGGGGTLELAAGAGTGTIGGLGGAIHGFKTIMIDAGAGWRFTGINTIAMGTTLKSAAAIVDAGTLVNNGQITAGALIQLTTGAEVDNAAGGKLFLTGNFGVAPASGATGTTVVNAGLIEKTAGTGTSVIRSMLSNTGQIVAHSGTLDLAAAVSGAGTLRIDAGATLAFGAAVAAGSKVSFLGTGGELELLDGADFAGKVAGFAATDSLDLRSIPFGTGTKVSYSGTKTSGTLTVSNGSHVANIALLGQFTAGEFAAANDGHGGTDITLSSAASLAFAPMAAPGH
jgi:hypothetical protein